uniref:Elongation of very long chain fatty acids protein n=1 Tax=Gallus gallus TaxID=9031 RepID=A0A8V0XEM8_CHICK
ATCRGICHQLPRAAALRVESVPCGAVAGGGCLRGAPRPQTKAALRGRALPPGTAARSAGRAPAGRRRRVDVSLRHGGAGGAPAAPDSRSARRAPLWKTRAESSARLPGTARREKQHEKKARVLLCLGCFRTGSLETAPCKRHTPCSWSQARGSSGCSAGHGPSPKSAPGLVTGVWEGGYNFYCQDTHSGGEADMKIIRVLWWYYFSKLIEFMDTFFFILRKNNHQITVLHVYHHATMLNIWWFVMNWVPCGHSYFGATLNSFIHVLMYSYYGLSAVPAMRPYLWWKKYITQGQLIQFVLTIFQTSCGVVWPCAFPQGWLYFQIFYMISLIILFTNFYIQTYNKKASSRRKEYQNGSTATVNGYTNSFSSLENNVKQRKQRKD